MKMSILIKDDVPLGFAVLAAAHASMAAYLKFKKSPEVLEWISGLFYKVVCRVDEKQFSKAKEYDDFVVLTESSLEGQEVALALKPRIEWPPFFKFLRLYR